MTPNITICQYTEFHYAECHVLFIVIINVMMLSVVTLNFIMLKVIMLNGMAPKILASIKQCTFKFSINSKEKV